MEDEVSWAWLINLGCWKSRENISFYQKLNFWSLYEIIHIWTAVVDESEEWSSQLLFQFKQLERRSLKKKNQGFNGIRTRDLRDTGAMLYQLSYEASHWERGQFIEFISSREEWNDLKYIWNTVIHIWTAVVDESEEW